MWQIQYSDERGGQRTVTVETADKMWAELNGYAKIYPRVAQKLSEDVGNGYSLQTASFGGWEPTHGFNVSLYVVDLDTHTPDGYTHEEAAELQAEFYGGEVPTADVVQETTHSVTLVTEIDDAPNIASFGTDAKAAQEHQRTLVKMITLSREPLPSVADHGPNWTTWTVSGEHDVFGSWRVILSANEDGAEQCGTCGEWFADSDAWGEHNDMAHY